MHYWSTEFSDLSLRYIYIPLGGTKNVALTTFLVFTFVALWHDLSFRLLAWGWLVSLFIAPELLAGYVLPPSKVRPASTSIRTPRTLTRVLAVREQAVVQARLRRWRGVQYVHDDGGKPCGVCDRHRRCIVYAPATLWHDRR